ncbi:cyanate transporter [uncultured Aquitalea sp.]|uniref:cyanate transporter n=1 Tax=uncultured Aquitalea sp. TaxID=540272 RepID=UPI0025D240B2|nr:cyanate transporter [uncultured Aquitalea sp.]
MTVKNHRHHSLALLLAIVLTGLNLRPALAAISPLLGDIRADLPLSFSMLSLLTMLPVVAMGLAMFWAPGVVARYGERRVIVAGLLAIGLASLARAQLSSAQVLIASALAAGCGIALIQALMPGLIKRCFPSRAAGMMGLYVTAIMGGAALAAAASSSLLDALGGWRGALASWSALAALALAAWTFAQGVEGAAGKAGCAQGQGAGEFAAAPRAWTLGIFFGLGTASYTCVLAWLPQYYVELGWSGSQAGGLLAWLTSMEVASGLLTPALASRSLDRRPVLFVLLLLIIAGFCGLAWAPDAAALLWAAMLGLGIGGLFPTSMIVSMDHLEDAARAGRLTAFVQGVGYLIAALSPLAAGWIRDASNGFTQSWLLLAACTVSMLWLAARFQPKHYARQFAGSGA